MGVEAWAQYSGFAYLAPALSFIASKASLDLANFGSNNSQYVERNRVPAYQYRSVALPASNLAVYRQIAL